MDCDLGEGWSAFFLLKKSKEGVSSGKSKRGPGCADSGGFYLLVCMVFKRFSTPAPPLSRRALCSGPLNDDRNSKQVL